MLPELESVLDPPILTLKNLYFEYAYWNAPPPPPLPIPPFPHTNIQPIYFPCDPAQGCPPPILKFYNGNNYNNKDQRGTAPWGFWDFRISQIYLLNFSKEFSISITVNFKNATGITPNNELFPTSYVVYLCSNRRTMLGGGGWAYREAESLGNSACEFDLFSTTWKYEGGGDFPPTPGSDEWRAYSKKCTGPPDMIRIFASDDEPVSWKMRRNTAVIDFDQHNLDNTKDMTFEYKTTNGINVDFKIIQDGKLQYYQTNQITLLTSTQDLNPPPHPFSKACLHVRAQNNGSGTGRFDPIGTTWVAMDAAQIPQEKRAPPSGSLQISDMKITNCTLDNLHEVKEADWYGDFNIHSIYEQGKWPSPGPNLAQRPK